MQDQLVPRYIVTEAAKRDPAYATPSTYDQQRAVFGPQKSLDELSGALARYQELGCSPSLGLDPQNCSWEDIDDRLAEVQAAYENKAKGIKGVVHKVTRKLGNNVDVVKPALDMLPDQYGLSIVKGALNWMLVLMQDTASRRDAILTAFKEVPTTLRLAETKRKHFPRDALLRDVTDELQEAVLDSLAQMIRFLLPKNQLVKVFPVFSTSPSGSQVDDSLKKVRIAVEVVRQHADLLVEGTIVQTKQLVEAVDRENHVTRFNTVQTLQAARDIQQGMQELSSLPQDVRELQKSVNSLQAQLLEVQERERLAAGSMAGFAALPAAAAQLSAVSEAGVLTQNRTHQMLMDLSQGFLTYMRSLESRLHERDEHFMNTMQMIEFEVECSRKPLPLDGLSAPGQTHGQTRQAQPLLTAVQLLDLLRISPDDLTRDLQTVIREGLMLDRADVAAQMQAQSLLRMNRFWHWMTTPASDLLMVSNPFMEDSGMPSIAEARVSSLSALCASIIGSIIQTNNQAVPLYFFCGCHLSAARTPSSIPYSSTSFSSASGSASASSPPSGDSLGGPQGLMRSLVARLLLTAQQLLPDLASMRLNFAPDEAAVEALANHDMASLCRVFRLLVSRFPRRFTIYCILDGVSWYERNDMLHDLFYVIQTLSNLVADTYLRPVIKVLLTSPFLSRRIAPQLPVHQRLILSDPAGVTSISGPNLLLNDPIPGRMMTPGMPGVGFLSARGGTNRAGMLPMRDASSRTTAWESTTAEDYF